MPRDPISQMKSIHNSDRILPAIAVVIALAAVLLAAVAIALRPESERPQDVPAALPPAPAVADRAPEPAPPDKSDPAAYTVWLVEEAIAYFDEHGREAALERYSSADSVDGQWYVAIGDPEGRILAHYEQDLIGESILGPIGTDIAGYRYGPVLASADEEGRWVSYVLLNPETGAEQIKHSWADRHQGLVFVSGWYEFGSAGIAPAPAPTVAEPAEFTQDYVRRAIEMYQRAGRDLTFAHYSSPESAVERWYLFVIDPEQDRLVLHPNPNLIGAKSAQRRDPKGYLYGPEMLTATEEGKWVSYFYRTYDGATAVEEGDKHTWLQRHDGLLFASGWYENVTPLPSRVEDPARFTQWYVQDAVDALDAGGLNGLLDRYGDPASIDGQWYAVVLGIEGTILADPTSEERVGRSIMGRAGFDLAGNHVGADFMAVGEEGAWLPAHYFVNPENGQCQVRHSWAVRRGVVIIASGWHEPAAADSLLPSKCEQAHFTVATVERAIDRYRSAGYDATIAFHNSPESADGRWYTFIVDAASGEIVAHPAATFVGVDLTGAPQGYGDAWYNYSADLMRVGAEGAFVRDVLSVPTLDERNPFHRIEEVKHYYAARHDDLIFVSGWYTPPPTVGDPSEFARLLVGRALTRHDDDGLDATLEFYNSPDSVDGPWYVFILEDRAGDLYTVGNAARPDLVGTTRERIDADGFDYGAAFAAVTEAGGGEWVSYLFTHPETGRDAPKHSWVVRRGDLVFGAGWYEGIGAGAGRR